MLVKFLLKLQKRLVDDNDSCKVFVNLFLGKNTQEKQLFSKKNIKVKKG